MFVTFGNVIVVNLVQPENAYVPNVVACGRSMVVRLVQPENA